MGSVCVICEACRVLKLHCALRGKLLIDFNPVLLSSPDERKWRRIILVNGYRRVSPTHIVKCTRIPCVVFDPFFYSEHPVNPGIYGLFSSLSLVPSSLEEVWEIPLIVSTWHGLDGSSRLGTAWYSCFILCGGFCCPRNQKLGKWKVHLPWRRRAY